MVVVSGPARLRFNWYLLLLYALWGAFAWLCTRSTLFSRCAVERGGWGQVGVHTIRTYTLGGTKASPGVVLVKKGSGYIYIYIYIPAYISPGYFLIIWGFFLKLYPRRISPFLCIGAGVFFPKIFLTKGVETYIPYKYVCTHNMYEPSCFLVFSSFCSSQVFARDGFRCCVCASSMYIVGTGGPLDKQPQHACTGKRAKARAAYHVSVRTPSQ